MTEAHDQSEFTILFQSLLNTKKVYLCNLQLSEMKLNGPERLICFARLQLLAPSCAIQRLLKLVIKSPVFRSWLPKYHTSLVVTLCTRTAEVVPTSCDPHLLAKRGMAEQLENQFLNCQTTTQCIHENYQQHYVTHLYLLDCKLLWFRRYLPTAWQSQQLLQQYLSI